jgi:hypothetical protein
MKLDAAIVTAGRTGERNIAIEKFWVDVEGNLPAGFAVTTRTGNGLEVTLEQGAYRKVYAGVGALQTGLTPVAPTGTTGRLIVLDTTTGETFEQPWTWHSLGGARSGAGLWRLLKRLLWKG